MLCLQITRALATALGDSCLLLGPSDSALVAGSGTALCLMPLAMPLRCVSLNATASSSHSHATARPAHVTKRKKLRNTRAASRYITPINTFWILPTPSASHKLTADTSRERPANCLPLPPVHHIRTPRPRAKIGSYFRRRVDPRVQCLRQGAQQCQVGSQRVIKCTRE